MEKHLCSEHYPWPHRSHPRTQPPKHLEVGTCRGDIGFGGAYKDNVVSCFFADKLCELELEDGGHVSDPIGEIKVVHQINYDDSVVDIG